MLPPIRNHNTSQNNTYTWNHKDTGKHLASIRLEWLGMYQSQLAIALNCSKDHVSRVERGKNEYTLSQIKKLEQLTGVSIDHMLEIESPTKASWIREYSSLSAKQRDIFDNLAKQALKLAQ